MSAILSNLTYDLRVCAALVELTAIIAKRYPSAQFEVLQGSDPLGIYLRPIVSADEAEDVLELVMDRLLDLQVEDGLPLYVFPIWTQECELSRTQTQVTMASGSVPQD
jgi:hypothetical protein